MRQILQLLCGGLVTLTLFVTGASANLFGMVDAESERSGNLRFISAMDLVTGAYGDHFREIDGYLTAGHVIPDFMPKLKLGDTATKMIVDLSGWVFKNGEPSPTIDENLQRVKEKYIGDKLSRVLAFLIKDEPYLVKDGSTNKKALETIITHVNKHFDGIPTYITFAEYCFDPSYNGPCVGRNLRGIPHNLDWVGFNFYTLLQGDLNRLSALFKRDIIGGVERIKKKCVRKAKGRCVQEQGLVNKPIVLTGEAFNALHAPNSVKDPKEARKRILHLIDLYLDYARHERSVIGVNFFTWPSVKNSREHINGINHDAVIKNKILNEGLKVTCGWKIKAGIDHDICKDQEMYIPRGPFRLLKHNYKVQNGEEVSSGGWQGYYQFGDTICRFNEEGDWQKVVGISISDWDWRITTIAKGKKMNPGPLPCNLKDIGIIPGAFKTPTNSGYFSTGTGVCHFNSQREFEEFVGFHVPDFERLIPIVPSYIKRLGKCNEDFPLP